MLMLGERVVRHRMSVEADKRDAALMSEAQEFPRWQEIGGEIVRGLPLDYDPTPADDGTEWPYCGNH